MTQPSKPAHATTADITAILAARKSAVIEAHGDPHSIPALPQSHAPTITAQPVNLPITQPATQPVAEAAPTPQVSDQDVSTFLDRHLPQLIADAQALIAPPFNPMEVVKLGLDVSQAVADGLPQMKGQEARALVVVVTRYLWRNYATPLLPVMVKPFAGVIESGIIGAIEMLYQTMVKPKKAA